MKRTIGYKVYFSLIRISVFYRCRFLAPSKVYICMLRKTTIVTKIYDRNSVYCKVMSGDLKSSMHKIK